MTPSSFTCSGCKQPLIAGSRYCQNCGLTFDVPVPAAPVPASGGVASAPTALEKAVVFRYQDAYRVAKATASFGTVIKIIGFMLGGAIFVGLLFSTDGQPEQLKNFIVGAGVVIGAIGAAAFYLFGVLVSAQGQLRKASLDGFVHSSPFLTDEQRAIAMSL